MDIQFLAGADTILFFHFQFFSQQMKVHLPLNFAVMQFHKLTNIASFYESITIARYSYSELMRCVSSRLW